MNEYKCVTDPHCPYLVECTDFLATMPSDINPAMHLKYNPFLIDVCGLIQQVWDNNHLGAACQYDIEPLSGPLKIIKVHPPSWREFEFEVCEQLFPAQIPGVKTVFTAFHSLSDGLAGECRGNVGANCRICLKYNSYEREERQNFLKILESAILVEGFLDAAYDSPILMISDVKKVFDQLRDKGDEIDE